MKELIAHPAILPLIPLFGIIFLLFVFQLVNRRKSLGYLIEKNALILLIFMICGVTITPFNKFTPLALIEREKTLPSLAAQIVLYLSTVFVLLPRLRFTLQKIIAAFYSIVIFNPGFCALVLLIVLSGFWSATPDYTFKNAGILLGTTIVLIYIAKQYDIQQFAELIRLNNTWIAIPSIYYSLFRKSIGINATKNSWQGILAHPNPLGSLMALNIFLWGVYAARNPKDRKKAFTIIFISLYVLQMAGTAGAKVQLILLTCLLLFVNSIKPLPFQWTFTGIVVFLILAIIGTILVTENLETIVVDGLGKDMTFTGRVPVWNMLFTEHIPKHPWFGFGYHGFWQPWRGLDNPAFNVIVMPSEWRPPHAHNGFVDTIVDLGFFGGLAFAISFITNLIYAVVYLSQKKGSEAALPLIFLTYVVITNLSEGGLIEVSMTWVLYATTTLRLSMEMSYLIKSQKPPKRLVTQPTLEANRMDSL
ncbi:O-antigen ligase family protein [Oxynema aestuarii]|uniref:O-antigen ligase family protein n=1 Tax=Oxynema aestuarii AP17 TaxID=2064643 RepID=A0A6H1TZH5_9CYAN|nr:O-antigen ligase family protein [Oxynema aestuarii]QIZ71557.1 O-antigen ligase family protein [Oxynema aestuarii AP17]